MSGDGRPLAVLKQRKRRARWSHLHASRRDILLLTRVTGAYSNRAAIKM